MHVTYEYTYVKLEIQATYDVLAMRTTYNTYLIRYSYNTNNLCNCIYAWLYLQLYKAHSIT